MKSFDDFPFLRSVVKKEQIENVSVSFQGRIFFFIDCYITRRKSCQKEIKVKSTGRRRESITGVNKKQQEKKEERRKKRERR